MISRRQLITTLVTACTILIGCDRAGRSANGTAGAGAIVQGEVKLRGADMIQMASAIGVTDQHVVFGDDADSMLKAFPRDRPRSLQSVGRRGSGPGEFRTIWSIQVRGGPGGEHTVWSYDPQLARLTGNTFDANGILGPGDSIVNLQLAGSPISVQWLNDSVLVASGFFVEARLALLDNAGRLTKMIGQIPLERADVPAFAAQQALQPSMAVRPGGGEVALGARYAGRIDIYSLPSGNLTSGQVPIPFSPAMTLSKRGELTIFVSGQDTRFGYTAITGTADRIYALFSGRTRSESGQAYAGQDVHVFTWSGEFLEAFRLDRDVVDIAITRNGKELFATAFEPEPSIVVYAIP